jgi:hypothetical protein
MAVSLIKSGRNADHVSKRVSGSLPSKEYLITLFVWSQTRPIWEGLNLGFSHTSHWPQVQYISLCITTKYFGQLHRRVQSWSVETLGLWVGTPVNVWVLVIPCRKKTYNTPIPHGNTLHICPTALQTILPFIVQVFLSDIVFDSYHSSVRSECRKSRHFCPVCNSDDKPTFLSGLRVGRYAGSSWCSSSPL